MGIGSGGAAVGGVKLASQLNPGGGGGGGGGSGQGVLSFDTVAAGGVELATFDATGLEVGTIAWVGNDTIPGKFSVHDYYSLALGEGLTADGIEVVDAFGPAGAQWKRLHIVDQQAIQKAFWSVNPATGNDENTGWGVSQAAADAVALKTMAALNHRLLGISSASQANVLIHLIGASIPASAFAILTNIQLDSQGGATVIGDRIPVDGSASNRTITAHQVAVPAANTERTITIAGLGVKPGYVHMMVQTTDGGKTAFVTGNPSADVFSISEPRSSDPTAFNLGSAVDFANGDHVSFFNLTTIPDWCFPPSGLVFPAIGWVRFDASASPGFFIDGDLGTSTPFMIQVIGGKEVSGDTSFWFRNGSDVVTHMAMFGQHANHFSTMKASHWSMALFTSAGDGPFLDGCAFFLRDEANFSRQNSDPGGIGFRSFGPGLNQIACLGNNPGPVTSLAMFRMNNFAISLLGVDHDGEPGNFWCDPGLVWYGNNPANNALIALQAGAIYKIPRGAGITASNATGIGAIGIFGADYEIVVGNLADIPNMSFPILIDNQNVGGILGGTPYVSPTWIDGRYTRVEFEFIGVITGFGNMFWRANGDAGNNYQHLGIFNQAGPNPITDSAGVGVNPWAKIGVTPTGPNALIVRGEFYPQMANNGVPPSGRVRYASFQQGSNTPTTDLQWEGDFSWDNIATEITNFAIDTDSGTFSGIIRVVGYP